MKLKRYFAREMRQVIRMVREELGPDAVILSNQRKEGGVEIVAAIDFEQSLEQLTADQPLTVADELPPEAVESSLVYGPAGVVNSGFSGQEEQNNEFGQVLNNASSNLVQLSSSREKKRAGKQESAPPHRLHAKNDHNPESRAAIATEQAGSGPDEAAFAEMRSELRYLRDVLENQLSGFAWGEMGRDCPQRVELLRRLLALGLSTEHCQSLANRIDDYSDPEQIWQQALSLLAAELRVTDDDIISQGGVIALVGPTGVGKTTTVAKLAARFALRHGYETVALVTTDSYRIAAYEQLRTYGRILGVPVRVVKNSAELSSALEAFRQKRLVLIDTAGMGQRDIRLASQFETILDGAPEIKSYVLLAANVQRGGVKEVVNSFKHLKLHGCILTKLDECVSLGGVLSVVVEQQLPVAYFCDGQRVPEDVQVACAQALVDRGSALLQESNESIDDKTMVLTMGGINANAGL